MNPLVNELNRMKISFDQLEQIRVSNGVLVYRVICGGVSYVLKYFENLQHSREINHYAIFNQLGIPTLKIVEQTDRALLMEDVCASSRYRLGLADDLNDVSVVRQLAIWYRSLHEKGKNYIKTHHTDFYDEADLFTVENIRAVRQKYKMESEPVWQILLDNYDRIRRAWDSTEKTITYNDFYYTNFVVAKDRTSAFMFDYNLLGKGYVYADIRNVCSSLGSEAQNAFLSAYRFAAENEKPDLWDKLQVPLDNVLSTIVTLVLACRWEKTPKWACSYIESIQNGTYTGQVEELIRLIK